MTHAIVTGARNGTVTVWYGTPPMLMTRYRVPSSSVANGTLGKPGTCRSSAVELTTTRAVEVEQRRDARADTARVVAQHGANRGVVAAADDGLLQPVVGDENVDGRQQFFGAIVHVLVEQHAGEADGAVGLRGRIALDEVEHRKQHDQLRRDDERDREQQNSVTKAVLFHAVAILRRPGQGLCAFGHGCAGSSP